MKKLKYLFFSMLSIIFLTKAYGYFIPDIEPLHHQLKIEMQAQLKQSAETGNLNFPLSNVTPFEWDEMCFYVHDDSNSQKTAYEWIKREFSYKGLTYNEPHKPEIEYDVVIFFTKGKSVVMYDTFFEMYSVLETTTSKEKCAKKKDLYVVVTKNEANKYWRFKIIKMEK